MMDSAFTDLELHDWLRWASEGGKVPTFVRTVADAARMACIPDYILLRPVLVELRRRHSDSRPDRRSEENRANLLVPNAPYRAQLVGIRIARPVHRNHLGREGNPAADQA